MKIIFPIILIILLVGLENSMAQNAHHYSFGLNTSNDQAIVIINNTNYSNDLGYGFDFENQQHIVVDQSRGFCTADVPFYFSQAVPEGVYDVAVTLGHPTLESITTIKAEARRLMVFNQLIPAGQTTTVHFTVSVRSAQIDTVRSIRLKPRETNYVNWDNKLSLEFSGKNVAVQTISIQPKEKYTSIFLAGNSTVTDQDCAPWASWGQMITRFFNQDIVVANYAESGEALVSFKSAGRLDKILSQMKPGDYLFIEFGHNDQKRKGEGIGPWLSFTDLLIEFVSRAREKGGIPVLCTPTQRRSFNDAGEIELTHGDYPAAMRKVAKDLNVPLIDLNAMTKTMYEAWGPEPTRLAFVQYPANTFPGQDKKLEDNTHFNTFGANEVAKCVLLGITEKVPELKPFLINFDGNYHPAHPTAFSNWDLIMSPRFVSVKPDGN